MSDGASLCGKKKDPWATALPPKALPDAPDVGPKVVLLDHLVGWMLLMSDGASLCGKQKDPWAKLFESPSGVLLKRAQEQNFDTVLLDANRANPLQLKKTVPTTPKVLLDAWEARKSQLKWRKQCGRKGTGHRHGTNYVGGKGLPTKSLVNLHHYPDRAQAL